jgi:hypothetical protein
MRKLSNESEMNEAEESVNVAAPEGEVNAQEETSHPPISPNTVRLLEAAIHSATEGISKGISQDFASEKQSSSIFNDIAELVIAPITLSAPSRALERGIKGTSMFYHDDKKVNGEAKDALQKRIITPSVQLYESNFAPLISVLDKIPSLTLRPLNDITNIEVMAIEFKGRDLSVSSMSPDSPYKIILKQIIPILREKFDAIVSFQDFLQEGGFVRYDELQRLYKAILEWRGVLRAFREGSDNTSGITDASGNTEKDGVNKGEASEQVAEEEDLDMPDAPIAENVYIQGVRAGRHILRDPTGEGHLYIDSSTLSSEKTPVIKLYTAGEGADAINSAGTGEKYLEYFINKGVVNFPYEDEPSADSLPLVVSNVTRESVSEGAEVTIYFDANEIRSLKGVSKERLELMRVYTKNRHSSIFVDNMSDIADLEKAASGETTTYYEAKSPSGETVYFTPSDLVLSGGKLRDSRGKSFKPRKVKGKSLADRVMSSGFGRKKRKS